MIGRDPALVVTEADDRFHPPTSDDPSWIETMWFPFWVPERAMTVYVRVWFSPNAGVQGGAVSGWNDAGGLFGEQWTDEFSGAPDLSDLSVPSGLHLRCVEPLHTYQLSHRGPQVELDVTFSASMEPNPVAPEESPGMFAGHLEQPGHVIGEVRLRGETIPVDCWSIRDRSWGPREMPADVRLGNAHGTADEFGFFTYVNPDPDGTQTITSGYLLLDGVAAQIVSGRRVTDWRDDRPTGVHLDVTDAAGRRFRTDGTCVNTMASAGGNGIHALLGLVRWEHAGGVAWGEHHDIWSEAAWLADGRPPL